MKRIRVDNLITVLFNQLFVLTILVEKETNSKNQEPMCFGLEQNGKNLVLKKKVKMTDKNGKITTHTSRKTYFI